MKRCLLVPVCSVLALTTAVFLFGCEGDKNIVPDVEETSVTGIWSFLAEGDASFEAEIILAQSDSNVTGTLHIVAVDGEDEDASGAVGGVVSGNSISLSIFTPWGEVILSGAVNNDQMGGSWDTEEGPDGTWSATRIVE